MLVQQLLVLGPGQPSGHCTQCANCCIHHICISVQVNLQQGTVMASFEMQRDLSYRQRSFKTDGARFRGLAAALGPTQATGFASAHEIVLRH